MTIVRIDIESTQRIAQQLSKAIPSNTSRAQAEFVALFLYTMVAGGVADYPIETRFARGLLVMRDGGDALVASIARVGRLTDAEVALELDVVTNQQPSVTS